jgi:vacuolar-type H+-ATPase subunit H
MEAHMENHPPEEAEPLEEESGARIQAIIDEAQQSSKRFIEEARRQSQLIIEQSREESQKKRAAMLHDARGRVDELADAAERMLSGINEMSGDLRQVTDSLRQTSEYLRHQVAELVGGESSRDRRRFGGRH